MLKSLLVSVLVLGLACASALAGSKAVKLKNGTTLVGEVTKTDDGYDVKLKYGVQSVKAEDVVSITDVVTPEDEYKERLAKINKDDPEARYSLGEWAFRNALYAEAQAELEAALALKPDFEKAQLKLRQVKAKISPTSKQPKDDEKTTTPDTPRTTSSELDEMLLKEDDIYRIRLAEARFSPSRVDDPRARRTSDDSIPINFRNKVLDAFIEGMAGKEDFARPKFAESFRTWRAPEQVSYMLKRLDQAGVQEQKDDIQVRSNPRVMVEFKRTIWPIVSGYCGAAQCHGGEKITGGYRLFNLVGKGDEADYTNFIILNGLKSSTGKRLIDRSQYDQSLLLQFGLPENLAEFKHPKARAGLFTSKRDPKYLAILNWIQSLAGSSLPDYKLKWTPPKGFRVDLSDRTIPSVLDEKPPAKTPAKTPAGGKGDDVPIRKE